MHSDFSLKTTKRKENKNKNSKYSIRKDQCREAQGTHQIKTDECRIVYRVNVYINSSLDIIVEYRG